MYVGNENVFLSAIDEERFGIITAKAPFINIEDIPYILEFCNNHQVKFLIARCNTTNLEAAQKMEHLGFLLMDTLVYFHQNLNKNIFVHDKPEIVVRPFREGEEIAVKAIAAESFKGYLGHYHADRRLEREICDEVYTDWAYKSCISKNVADEVLIAELEGVIAGFATLRVINNADGEGVLFGVSPFAQGKGIYRQLMIGGMNWCLNRGLTHMIVSTQVTNVIVQKVWTRMGFEPCYSFYTFHKWFIE